MYALALRTFAAVLAGSLFGSSMPLIIHYQDQLVEENKVMLRTMLIVSLVLGSTVAISLINLFYRLEHQTTYAESNTWSTSYIFHLAALVSVIFTALWVLALAGYLMNGNQGLVPVSLVLIAVGIAGTAMMVRQSLVTSLPDDAR